MIRPSYIATRTRTSRLTDCHSITYTSIQTHAAKNKQVPPLRLGTLLSACSTRRPSFPYESQPHQRRNMSSAARQKFQTECGHTFTVAPVEAVGGKMEGKWQLRVSGPKVTGKSGVKCMYSDPDQASALKAAARFLRCHIFTITPAIGPDAAADKTREPLGPIERMPERQVARGRSRPDATKAPAKAATEEAHHAEGVSPFQALPCNTIPQRSDG